MIKIMVDSGADCAKDSGAYDLLIPLNVSVDGREYQDGVNLSADRFYALLASASAFPQTSQPSPEAFVQIFEKIKADGDEVLCFTISSALSGTYQSARIAKSMVDYDGIYIIDTLAVTHMIEVLARHAAALVRQGLPAREIAARCEQLKTRVRVLAGLDTLEYLYKGGRLSRASAAVGTLAGIKPVVTMSGDGKVAVAAKAIGVPRAMATILTKLKADRLDPAFPLYTLYSSGRENSDVFVQKLAAAGYESAACLQVGPTIGAHVGPGVYGVIYVLSEE